MLQRSSLPSTSPADIADSLQRTLDRSWLRSLRDTLRLPGTWQQYMLLLAIALVLGAGMAMQVLLAVQTEQAQFQLSDLRAEYARVGRENADLIYQIADRTSLRRIQEQALKNSFVPATGRLYIFRNQLAGTLTGSASGAATGALSNDLAAAPPAAGAVDQAAGVQPSPALGPLESIGRQIDQAGSGWFSWTQTAESAVRQAIDQFGRDVMGRVR